MTIIIINLAFDMADVAAICPKGKWIPNLALSPHLQTFSAAFPSFVEFTIYCQQTSNLIKLTKLISLSWESPIAGSCLLTPFIH